MSEIVTPLHVLSGGEVFVADEDGAFVITEKHSHSDVLRYVVADIGAAEAAYLIETMARD